MKTQDTLPEIALVGMSHKTASVDMRECFSVPEERIPSFLASVRSAGIEEAVYVSTCNRVEIYFASRDIPGGMRHVIGLLEEVSSMRCEEFETSIYRKYGRDAAHHLLTVASSLDSMVVGENEILGQVKKSYARAVQDGTSGVILNRLFHQAFHTAKRVRTETEIAKNPLSIAYIATELARKIFENLTERRALLVGAGEMGELILKYLTKHQIGDVIIANRSLHNAERIASEINREARVVTLDDIADAASDVDIIVSSVASRDYLLTLPMVRSFVKKRAGQPLFMIDIAVPRNIDPEVNGLHGVFLYNIDDLKSIADENLKNRLSEVEIARGLIESDADEFYRWYEGLLVVPAIMRIQEKFDEIRRGELKKYRQRKLKNLSDEEFARVEDLTIQIMTKTLHNPIMRLKEYQSRGGHREKDSIRERTKLIMELFDK